MKFKICILFISIATFVFGQDTTNAFKIKYYTEKINLYLDKQKAIAGNYSIDKEGIKIFSSVGNKTKGVPEFKVSWNKVEDLKLHFKSCTVEKVYETYKKGDYDKMVPCVNPVNVLNSAETNKNKLQGLKVAIDPGHFAGNTETGKIEIRHLYFKKNAAAGLPDSIDLTEGILTFATATLLKQKLEKEGAEVMLTRNFNGSTSFNKTFDEWLKNDFKKYVDSIFKAGEITSEKKQWLLIKATKRDKFKLIFKDLELKKRAEIINNYKPDVTIIIHFNVDETNTGWTKPGNKDFDMAFVGGAFMRNDLATIEKRFEFLHLLVTDDLEKSIALSGETIKSFETILNVKTASVNDAKYLTQSCLTTNQKGVYCRNLQLTRYVHSPLVYGETLYQDNINECKLLNKEKDKTKNERVQQVAEAYFQGILNYVNSTTTKINR